MFNWKMHNDPPLHSRLHSPFYLLTLTKLKWNHIKWNIVLKVDLPLSGDVPTNLSRGFAFTLIVSELTSYSSQNLSRYKCHLVQVEESYRFLYVKNVWNEKGYTMNVPECMHLTAAFWYYLTLKLSTSTDIRWILSSQSSQPFLS